MHFVPLSYHLSSLSINPRSPTDHKPLNFGPDLYIFTCTLLKRKFKMAYKEKTIEKKYYTIGEVASMFKVATSLIRFWESEFDIIKPRKNKRGNRQFTKEDIDNVRIIYHLVKEKGYTLQGAKDEIKKHGVTTQQVKIEMIDALKNIKDFLTTLKDQLPS